MPQAIERLLARPKIRPRLPRMRPEVSGIMTSIRRSPAVVFPYDTGVSMHQARRAVIEQWINLQGIAGLPRGLTCRQRVRKFPSSGRAGLFVQRFRGSDDGLA